MEFNSVFINVLSIDISNTKYFYQQLGFSIVEEYSNDETLALKINEGAYLMFLSKKILESFTHQKVQKVAKENQIISFFVKDETELMIFQNKLKNILNHPFEINDGQYMRYIKFIDINGYNIEISYYK